MVIIHPKDYRRWRNLATLYVELGERVFYAAGFDTFAVAMAKLFVAEQHEFR
jgi:hypothetical protein